MIQLIESLLEMLFVLVVGFICSAFNIGLYQAIVYEKEKGIGEISPVWLFLLWFVTGLIVLKGKLF